MEIQNVEVEIVQHTFGKRRWEYIELEWKEMPRWTAINKTPIHCEHVVSEEIE